jgi:hypothetical protein
MDVVTATYGIVGGVVIRPSPECRFPVNGPVVMIDAGYPSTGIIVPVYYR